MKNALGYILDNANARKHVRHIGHVAYVDGSTSGETFDGWTEPWPQVQAWTWLLDEGWRKRGLISPFGNRARRPPLSRTR